jgi:predicted MFS family arabinose efflux permease
MGTTAYNPLEMPHELTPELEAYYSDKKLMWRNILWFMLLNLGWGMCFTVVNPLMTLRMNSPAVGMDEGMIGMIAAINGYAVSFLVMYFSWKSDHTISRWGRRIPFLWISTPFILVTVVIFPFIDNKWILLCVMIVQLFFMDIKLSTISLLPIDLVPRRILARTNVVPGIVMGIMGFFVLRYGMKLSDLSEKLPFLIGAGVMLVTSIVSGLNIKEPPIQTPATEPFKPWSALKVGWRDRRMIILMLAVPMLGALPMLYNTWIWLFAKNELNLTRTEMGASLSWASILGLMLTFPCAWLIDRISPYKLAAIFVILNGALLASLMWVSSQNGLILVAFMFVLATAFGGAASMMVFRMAHPKDVGSVTSSLALVNNAFNATLALLSGQLIERLGQNYKAAFILGFCLCILGLMILLFYRHLMKSGRKSFEDLNELLPENAAGNQ